VEGQTGLLAAAFLLAAGVSFLTPAFYRVLMERAGPERRGAAAATFSVLVDLGIGVGPIVVGIAARFVGLQGAFAASAATALVVGVVGLLVYRRPQPSEQLT
jgi:MFS family permease